MSSLSSRRIAGPLEVGGAGLIAVPTGLTSINSVDTVVYQIIVSNTTAGALTFLVKDKQGTPGQIVPTISVAANSVSIIPYGEGVQCPGGLQWQASGAGLQAEIYGNSHT